MARKAKTKKKSVSKKSTTKGTLEIHDNCTIEFDGKEFLLGEAGEYNISLEQAQILAKWILSRKKEPEKLYNIGDIAEIDDRKFMIIGPNNDCGSWGYVDMSDGRSNDHWLCGNLPISDKKLREHIPH